MKPNELDAFSPQASVSFGASEMAQELPLRQQSLRICVISETMMTGVGRHVTDLVRGMALRGHEVHLLHSIERCDEELFEELASLSGCHRQAFPMRRRPHWSDVPVLIALARYLRRFGPFDIMHGHSSKGGAYARLLNPFVPGTCLYTPHAFVTMARHLSRTERAAYAALELCMAPLTDTLICLSKAEAEHAAKLGIGGHRLALIPNGIAPFDARPAAGFRASLDLPSDAVIIGFVGRLDEQKAPRLLVQAAREVIDRRDDAYVVLVGAGPLRPELEILADKLGIAHRLRWAGAVPARAWMAEFDMLAMPSFYEGFPYVLLEALTAGLPIVCTPVGGTEDVQFLDGVQGYIVPLGDHRALADRLCRLAADPDLRRRMGRKARETSARFSLERMIDRLEVTYRRTSSASPFALASCREKRRSD
jgi:glycosyltransferase involved in cell wall biosynthesis